MKKLINIYNKFEEYVLVASLLFTVCLLFYNICSREFAGKSLSWAEECARYVFIFQIWLGVSIAEKYDKHIKVEILQSAFKSQLAKSIVDIIGRLIMIGFNLLLCKVGVELCLSMLSRGTLSTAMRFPMYVLYGILPLSCILMAIRMIPPCFNDIKNLFTGKKEVTE